MARIPGVRGTNQPASAVALVCHYDSVPTGPGASDDGAAVAAVLETARARKAGPALRNDVMLLLTDGEEVPGALPGAEAFAKDCPWMKDIGCVLNFDARGVSGPVLMYETSTCSSACSSTIRARGPFPLRSWRRACSLARHGLKSSAARPLHGDSPSPGWPGGWTWRWSAPCSDMALISPTDSRTAEPHGWTGFRFGHTGWGRWDSR
jgi:Peptidase family M28